MLDDPRSHTFEDALIRVMGCMVGDLPPDGKLLHVLFQPTFHQPSCLVIERRAAAIEISLAILQAPIGDLWSRVWTKGADPLDPDQLKPRRCYSDIVDLPAPQQQRLEHLIADRDLLTLPDYDGAARDGIAIRCHYVDQRTRHIARMTSPPARFAPKHWKLMTSIIDIARGAFGDEYAREYFDILRRYFHD